MKAVLAAFGGAAKGAARIVDQEIPATGVVQQELGDAVSDLHVGDAHRVGNELQAPVLGLQSSLIELVLVAARNENDRARLGKYLR